MDEVYCTYRLDRETCPSTSASCHSRYPRGSGTLTHYPSSPAGDHHESAGSKVPLTAPDLGAQVRYCSTRTSACRPCPPTSSDLTDSLSPSLCLSLALPSPPTAQIAHASPPSCSPPQTLRCSQHSSPADLYSSPCPLLAILFLCHEPNSHFSTPLLIACCCFTHRFPRLATTTSSSLGFYSAAGLVSPPKTRVNPYCHLLYPRQPLPIQASPPSTPFCRASPPQPHQRPRATTDHDHNPRSQSRLRPRLSLASRYPGRSRFPSLSHRLAVASDHRRPLGRDSATPP